MKHDFFNIQGLAFKQNNSVIKTAKTKCNERTG